MLLLVPLLLPTPASPCAAQPTPRGNTVERQTLAMGTHLRVEVTGSDRAAALAASEVAVRAVQAVEQRLSTWTDTSELARLNATPAGEVFRASPELARDLARARALHAATQGSFDPGIGALVEAWGLRSGGRLPSHDSIGAALESGGLAALSVDSTDLRRENAALRIEEGAFGKGAALDAALAALRGAGASSGLVDLGGQIAILPTQERPAGRTVPVAHPDRRDEPALLLTLPHGSLATSGNSERAIMVDGVRRSHVLDPRTGQPAADFGSVSVWAIGAFEADALSTALYVMGPERGLAWAAERDGVEALYLERTDDGLRARATAGLRERILRTAGGLPVAYVERTSSDRSTPADPIPASRRE